jgi:hypothetical protein
MVLEMPLEYLSGGVNKHTINLSLRRKGAKMKIKTILISLCFLICFQSSPADVTSLSQIFKIGKGLLDRDGDGLAEKIAIRIFLPDNPHSQELALASDIAARSNLESLVVDFDLVRQESLPDPAAPNSIFILLGTSAKYKLSSARASNQDLPELGNNQGHFCRCRIPGSSFKNRKGFFPALALSLGHLGQRGRRYIFLCGGRSCGFPG